MTSKQKAVLPASLTDNGRDGERGGDDEDDEEEYRGEIKAISKIAMYGAGGPTARLSRIIDTCNRALDDKQ